MKSYAVVYEIENKFYVLLGMKSEPVCPGRVWKVFSGDVGQVLKEAQNLMQKLNKPPIKTEAREKTNERRPNAKTNKYPHRISRKDAAGLAKFIGLL